MLSQIRITEITPVPLQCSHLRHIRHVRIYQELLRVLELHRPRHALREDDNRGKPPNAMRESSP